MPKPKRSVLKVDKRTGEVLERYNSTTEAGNDNGLNRSSVWYLAEHEKLTPEPYLFRFEDAYTGNEKFKTTYNVPIVVEDLKYNQVAWFSTVTEAAQKIMYDRDTFYKALTHNGTIAKRFKPVLQIGFSNGRPILARPLEGRNDQA